MIFRFKLDFNLCGAPYWQIFLKICFVNNSKANQGKQQAETTSVSEISVAAQQCCLPVVRASHFSCQGKQHCCAATEISLTEVVSAQKNCLRIVDNANFQENLPVRCTNRLRSSLNRNIIYLNSNFPDDFLPERWCAI